ncbi:MAG: hypothetical protein WCA76_16690 [Candidatus Sulfotelmatobacter sp.]
MGLLLGLKDPELGAEAVDVLVTGHSWPENTRELENMIHHALLGAPRLRGQMGTSG